MRGSLVNNCEITKFKTSWIGDLAIVGEYTLHSEDRDVFSQLVLTNPLPFEQLLGYKDSIML